MVKFVNYQDGQAIDPRTGEVYNLTEKELAFVQKMEERNMTPDGREIPDPRPYKPHVKVTKQMSMFDYHRQAIALEIQRREALENETVEEALDFGQEADDEIVEHLSEYEQADLEAVLYREQKREADEAAAKAAADAKKPKPKARSQGAKPAEGGAEGGLDGEPGEAKNE